MNSESNSVDAQLFAVWGLNEMRLGNRWFEYRPGSAFFSITNQSTDAFANFLFFVLCVSCFSNRTKQPILYSVFAVSLDANGFTDIPYHARVRATLVLIVECTYILSAYACKSIHVLVTQRLR